MSKRREPKKWKFERGLRYPKLLCDQINTVIKRLNALYAIWKRMEKMELIIRDIGCFEQPLWISNADWQQENIKICLFLVQAFKNVLDKYLGANSAGSIPGIRWVLPYFIKKLFKLVPPESWGSKSRHIHCCSSFSSLTRYSLRLHAFITVFCRKKSSPNFD